MASSDFDDERWVPDEAIASLSLEKDLNPDETHIERAKRLLTENADVAAASLVWMSRNSNNERIRLESSKHILDRVLGRAGDAPATGALDDLFSNLDKLLEAEDTASQQRARNQTAEELRTSIAQGEARDIGDDGDSNGRYVD